MSTLNLRTNPFVNQRRSQRILLCVPLRVSGKQANGTPFAELTNTLIVSAHGALLHLREQVREGQALSLRNVATGEEVPCVVIDVNTGTLGAPEIGVEFTEANPRFWRVSFPPPEWNTRGPEAKRFASGRAAAVVVPPPVKVPASKK